jgi:hypothetical protein
MRNPLLPVSCSAGYYGQIGDKLFMHQRHTIEATESLGYAKSSREESSAIQSFHSCSTLTAVDRRYDDDVVLERGDIFSQDEYSSCRVMG